jgi:predicted Zn-dependent peptidase
MKIFLSTIFTLITGSFLMAQEAPKTEEFSVEGMHVILRQSVKGTVSARLFLEGGVANYPKEKEGIESLTLQLVMEGGPEEMSKEEFQTAKDRAGARLGSSTTYDYSNMSLNCVKMYWDESWDLFSEAIVNPAFREDDFELVKNQMITAAKQAKANPDVHLSNLSMEKTWEGTDYAKRPSGTPESLESITLDDVKEYYDRVVGKERVFLVIVGDVQKEDVIRKVGKTIAEIPSGEPAPELYAGEKVKEGVYVENRKIQTNYIKGFFDAPAKGTEESIHNLLAMSILYDRFFEELRTKRSLSYAPMAGSTGYAARPMNQVYISTTDPKQSLEVMIEELNKVKTEGFEQKELDGTKQSFLTNYYMGQETNSSISQMLGVFEIYNDWSDVDKFTKTVLSTDLEDINTVLQKYGDEISWIYLGKEEEVNPEDFKQPVQTESIKK